jgi:hypothetical protein
MTATAIGAYATAAALKARMNIATADTTDDTVIGLICDQVNAYIEGPQACGRVIAPISSAVYLFDGDGSNCLRYPKGIRAVSLLEIAYYTGGAYQTVASTDYFLRPGPAELTPGWPYNRIELSNLPLGAFIFFPVGFNTVRVTMTTGFAAIPDDITEVALVAAARAWHAVGAGQADIVGTDEMGRPLVSRFFSKRDLETLAAYSLTLPG